MIIDAYTFCWNEQVKLEYFLRLWSPLCRRVVVFDNGSTDDSQKVASKYENVVWDVGTVGDKFDDYVKQKVSNKCWVDASGDADLVYIGDIDEILYHPSGLKSYYEKKIKEDYNVFKPYAYDMVNVNLPTHPGQIYDHRGFKIGHRIYDKSMKRVGKDPCSYDKCSVFSPKAIDKVWFSRGFHKSVFTGGNIKVCYEPDYKLLHYKYIGRERFVEYNLSAGKRINVEHGIGSTYQLTTENELYRKFDRRLRLPSKQII